MRRLLCISIVCFSAASNLCLQAQPCDVGVAPQNLWVSNISSCGANLHWSSMSGALDYVTGYENISNSIWVYEPATSDSFYEFSGLDSNENYIFSVYAECTSGQQSLEAQSSSIHLPAFDNITVTTVVESFNNATINFTTKCPHLTYWCKFGLSQSNLADTITSSDNLFSITGLLPNTTYYFEATANNPVFNHWTAIDSLHTLADVDTVPNVILIILDDTRYDFFSCNGAPSFYQTPNIDRIANEGANFKNMFVVHSLCAPSRASIATGDYTFMHHVTDNGTQDSLNKQLPQLPDLLKFQGYYTALIGKYHGLFNPEERFFNYWMGEAGNDDNQTTSYSFNGTDTTVTGYDSDVYSDSASAIIERSTSPFFIWLGYTATHTPLIPEPQYTGLYDNDTMPIGGDTARYTHNFPSCIYNLEPEYYADSAKADSIYFLSYEELTSVDDGIGKIFQALQNSNKLDNTLIIFTSDNGHLIGEHGLNMKRAAYEQSIRVPLFVRYPQWFYDSTLVTNQIALNIDIAPSILEAAKISYDSMQGLSIHKLFTGQSTRTEMFYHYWYSSYGSGSNLPDIRAVRDLHYKYVKYGCSQYTSEFFDILNDPEEMHNLIASPTYAPLVTYYNTQLLQMQNSLGDTTGLMTILPCYSETINSNATQIESSGEFFKLYPNPASTDFTIENNLKTNAALAIYDDLGNCVKQLEISPGLTTMQTTDFSSGLYFVALRTQEQVFNAKLLIAH